METTFYEEGSFRCGADHPKRNMTLDLTGTAPSGRAGVPVNSSDLNMLMLGTPELEMLIMDQHDGPVLNAPTPTTVQILFPRNVTEDQKSYARGFVEALSELRHSDSSLEGNAAGASGYPGPSYPPAAPVGFGFAESSSSPIAVKDEPQTVPDPGSTPPLSPIDMECQERIKLERKRLRNRVAASKCRRRKLDRIARLEDKVKLLKGENAELASVANKLREQVCSLKEEAMEHVHSGCQILTGLPHFS